MKIQWFCHNCNTARTTTESMGGTQICNVCLNLIRCIDCGGPYTDNCAEGSVFVPARTERTYHSNMEVELIKVEPRVCEKPVELLSEDSTGLRCFNADGPPVKAFGEIRNHMCVLRHDHRGQLHYAFSVDDHGMMTWYEWGWT